MLDPHYFETLTIELTALKNRVRSFIHNKHWLTDGEWKESVLRAFLRRNLPRNIEIGRGFVITEEGRSTQIDVLIYDAAKPVLFQDGALVIVTADAVLGAIEVKTSLHNTTFRKAAGQLSRNLRLIQGKKNPKKRVYGLFSFADGTSGIGDRLQDLKGNGDLRQSEVINLICLGNSTFIRFWECDPEDWPKQINVWRAYTVEDQAPGYFIHNVVQQLCPESVEVNKRLWYPESKGRRMTAELALKPPA